MSFQCSVFSFRKADSIFSFLVQGSPPRVEDWTEMDKTWDLPTRSLLHTVRHFRASACTIERASN